MAFGSIATPIVTLAGTTELPIDRLSAAVGRICAPVSLFIPAYLILVMAGWKGLHGVFGAAMACGIAFAGTQFLVSNYIGPELTDILSSMAAMGALLLVIRKGEAAAVAGTRLGNRMAWAPYVLLVVFVLLWGSTTPLQARLLSTDIPVQWPGLHNVVQRMPPVVAEPAPYAAYLQISLALGAGTSCLFAAILAPLVVGLSRGSSGTYSSKPRSSSRLAELTLAAVLALAYPMNYSGATATLGLAFAATGALFPFFSAMLGWLGVFLTGSDTSANALFGTLQIVTATSWA